MTDEAGENKEEAASEPASPAEAAVVEEYDLRVSEDRLAVLLDALFEEKRLSRLAERVEGGLRALNIPEAPAREAIEEILRTAYEETDKGLRITDLAVVKGRAPTPAVDGAIEWADEFFSSGFAVDEKTGAINYRERKAKPSVQAGDLLATVTPPEHGEEGVTVFGKRIPAPRGRVAPIRQGTGVTFDSRSSKYSAATSGRVRYIDGVVHVDQIFSVSGSVGLRTGNIDHPGALVIEHDIEGGSHIRADGDITVGGIIDTAEIETGGSLEVGGGITGSKSVTIKVAGRVHAKFLLETSISAGQDILVEKEILHSNIKCQGSVSVPAGRLVGGDVYARTGIDVRQAGSEGAVRTILLVGVVGDMAKTVSEKEKELIALQESASKIRRTIRPLVAIVDTLPSEKRSIVQQLMDKLSEIEDQISQLEEQREKIQGKGRSQIIIRDIVYPETILGIDYATMRFKEALKGPIRAVASHDKILLQPWSGGPIAGRSR